MIDLDLCNDDNTSSNEIGRSDCATHIYESIQNMKRKLCGKFSSVRFSTHTINVAMSLFLRSKKGYDDIRISGLLCLPSPRLLAG